MLTDCLLTSSTKIVSSRTTVMLRLFGTNDTSIGKSQSLPKVVRLTVSLNNVLVILGGVNNVPNKKVELPKLVKVYANSELEVMTRCTPTEVAKDLPTVLQYLDLCADGRGIMSLNDEDGTPERSYHINLAD